MNRPLLLVAIALLAPTLALTGCDRSKSETSATQALDWQPRLAKSKGDYRPLLKNLPLGELELLTSSAAEDAAMTRPSDAPRLLALETNLSGATDFATAWYKSPAGVSAVHVATYGAAIEVPKLSDEPYISVPGILQGEGAPLEGVARVTGMLPKDSSCRLFWSHPKGGNSRLTLQGVKKNALFEIVVPGAPPGAMLDWGTTSFAALPLWQAGAPAQIAEVYRSLDLDLCGKIPPKGLALPKRAPGMAGVTRAVVEETLTGAGWGLSLFDAASRSSTQFTLSFGQAESGAKLGVMSASFEDGFDENGWYLAHAVNDQRVVTVTIRTGEPGSIRKLRDKLATKRIATPRELDLFIRGQGFEPTEPVLNTPCMTGVCSTQVMTVDMRADFTLHRFAPSRGADGNATAIAIDGRRVLAVYTLEKPVSAAPGKLLSQLTGEPALERAHVAASHDVNLPNPAFDSAMNAGRKATSAKKYLEAEVAFRRALSVSPASAQAHAERGYARLLARQWQDAEADFSKALSLDPDPKLKKQIVFNQKNLAARRADGKGSSVPATSPKAGKSGSADCSLSQVLASSIVSRTPASFAEAFKLIKQVHDSEPYRKTGELHLSATTFDSKDASAQLLALFEGKSPHEEGVWLVETSRAKSSLEVTFHLLFASKEKLTLYPAIGARTRNSGYQSGDFAPKLRQLQGYSVLTLDNQVFGQRTSCTDSKGKRVDCSQDNSVAHTGAWVESLALSAFAFDATSFRYVAGVRGELSHDGASDTPLPDSHGFIGKYQPRSIGIFGCGRDLNARW